MIKIKLPFPQLMALFTLPYLNNILQNIMVLISQICILKLFSIRCPTPYK